MHRCRFVLDSFFFFFLAVLLDASGGGILGLQDCRWDPCPCW